MPRLLSTSLLPSDVNETVTPKTQDKNKIKTMTPKTKEPKNCLKASQGKLPPRLTSLVLPRICNNLLANLVI